MWTRSVTIDDREIAFETGAIARQANGAVIVREGDTTLLVTVTASRRPKDADFLPLFVEYRFKAAAAGTIPGSFLRREGRITDDEVLFSRIIDRTIRPLFAKTYRWDTQVLVTVLSSGAESDLAGLGLCGVALALAISDLPFEGPVAGLRFGRRDGLTIAMPPRHERDELDLEVFVSAHRGGIVMVEGGGREAPESEAIAALTDATEQLAPVFALIDEARAEVGKAKRELPAAPPPPEGAEAVEARARPGLLEVYTIAEKMARGRALSALREAIEDEFAETCPDAGAVVDALHKRLVRERTLAGTRLDGRGPEDIRAISGMVRWLPVPHGSALFTRGETQAIVTATLGTERDAQLVEGPDGAERRRFLLHYNFPPFSVGEVRPMRGPGRREIGHGRLAWQALQRLLPDDDAFPYTLRVESTITESNGSSSMATVCGGCLAMMDAGVPLPRPVAGIAMGLMVEGDEVVVLSDILGDEDHVGDMDFKVAGTSKGITAIQLDNKIGAVAPEIMARAFEQAARGRLHILGEMAKILEGPRTDLPPGVPRAISLKISTNRIGSLVGPGGKHIRGIESESGATVSVDDEGTVTIFAPSDSMLEKARELVVDFTGLPKVGESYLGTVTTVKPFGAFVRIFEGIEGLVQAEQFGSRPASPGQKVPIKVKGMSSRGKIEPLMDRP